MTVEEHRVTVEAVRAALLKAVSHKQLARICREAGVSRSTAIDFAKGRHASLRFETMAALADGAGVPLSSPSSTAAAAA